MRVAIKAQDVILGASFCQTHRVRHPAHSNFSLTNPQPVRSHVIKQEITSELWTNERAHMPPLLIVANS